MKKRNLFIILGVLCFIAAIVMWSFRNDSHLSELGEFCLVPVPLGIICVFIALKSKK